jgi:hypothetical protein
MGDEPMLLTATLLTPMLLAAEPIRLDIPDRTYDHQTQTSTFKGSAKKRLKLASTLTTTNNNPCGPDNRFRCSDYDKDY